MNNQDKQQKLHKDLKKIIRKMRRIQKNIAATEQPVAMHELDTLTALGQRYARVVGQLDHRKA